MIVFGGNGDCLFGCCIWFCVFECVLVCVCIWIWFVDWEIVCGYLIIVVGDIDLCLL